MSIEVNNESGVGGRRGRARATSARFVLDALGINPLAELSIVLIDADTMAALHQQWMDLPGPTDVMAFPMDAADGTGPGRARTTGAIRPRRRRPRTSAARCSATSCCARRSPPSRRPRPGTRVDAELQLLCTHGVLHLLGYDHGEPDEEREMFELQARLLARVDGGQRRRADPRAGPGHRRRECATAAKRARRARTAGSSSRWSSRSRSCRWAACSPRRLRAGAGVRGPRRGVAARGARGAQRAADDHRATAPATPTCCCCCGVSCELTATVLVTIVARGRVRHPLAGAAAHRPGHGRRVLRRSSGSGRARSAGNTPTAVALAGAPAVRAARPGVQPAGRRC